MRVLKKLLLSILCATPFISSNVHSEQKKFVIGSILGGLGNQMFEVATTCAVAWDNGAKPYFPDYIPLLPHSQSFHHVLFRRSLHPPNSSYAASR